ncbi:MAG: NACHT domain-containing protein, partial [Cyanobacteria bacterium P01_H01_bin.130]
MGDSQKLPEQKGIIANDNSQVRVEKVINNFLAGDVPAVRPDAELQLLREMAIQVEGRLADALGNRVYVETDKVRDRRWVEPLWNGTVKMMGAASSEPCPEGTEIIDIFNRKEIGGKLLILGAPGAGKTTLLLRLARVLVAQAIEDARLPVPVLFELSTWKPPFKEIRDWLVADLRTNPRRKVRKDLAQQWVEEKKILPLLDGLDELMSERQETCVQALNRFLPEWSGVPLVVCSRLEEYGIYESDLKLNGAVVVQPLSDSQIETFLRDAGKA